MSIRTIITEGYGIFGTIPDVVRMGYAPGIALEAETGIGLARPPAVDFVFSNGWYASLRRDLIFPQHRKLFEREKRQAVKQDGSDMRELMKVYSEWRRAA